MRRVLPALVMLVTLLLVGAAVLAPNSPTAAPDSVPSPSEGPPADPTPEEPLAADDDPLADGPATDAPRTVSVPVVSLAEEIDAFAEDWAVRGWRHRGNEGALDGWRDRWLSLRRRLQAPGAHTVGDSAELARLTRQLGQLEPEFRPATVDWSDDALLALIARIDGVRDDAIANSRRATRDGVGALQARFRRLDRELWAPPPANPSLRRLLWRAQRRLEDAAAALAQLAAEGE